MEGRSRAAREQVTLFLTVDQVIALHGDRDGAALIDRGKLEAAVPRPQASFGATFLHATVYKQASVLLHGITQAHAFLDANKRTAWVASITFLELNGVRIIDLDPHSNRRTGRALRRRCQSVRQRNGEGPGSTREPGPSRCSGSGT
ncbi:type II toxin-antitoxin system death-on-curing family toxin [Rathayibacter tritici]|nr:type II toxin-antitoxin system death-on-curing family toxin [Rathayibacter tritici]